MPVLLLDRFNQLITFAGLDRATADSIVDSLGQPKITESLSSPDAKPCVVTVGEMNLLVGHAMDGRGSVGLLIALQAEAPSTEMTVRIIELGCLYVALEVLKQHAAIEAEMRLQLDFADALVAAEGSGLDLTRRAAMLGIRLSVPNEVLRARVSGLSGELDSLDASELSTAVRRTLAGAGIGAVVSPIRPTDFVVMIPSDSLSAQGMALATSLTRRTIRDGIAALQRANPREIKVAIGIGKAGTGVDALRASHTGALRALEVIAAVGSSDDDLRISDAGSFSLLAMAPAQERQEFVDRYLQNLMAYDRSHGTDLIETLRTYFSHVGNAQRTAEAMYLHVSTIRYRLTRIEQLAEVSLHSDDDRLSLQLALRLADMTTSKAVGQEGA
jgi:sugar diacid utilization regulator